MANHSHKPRRGTLRGAQPVAAYNPYVEADPPKARRPIGCIVFLFMLIGIVVAVLTALANKPSIPEDIERTASYPLNYQGEIKDSAARHGVDVYLVCGIIRTESSWNPQAISRAGAQGLMQITPETVEFLETLGTIDTSIYSPANIYEPATNIEYGCALLEYLQSECANVDEVLAAYNAGLGTVERWRADVEQGRESSFTDAISYGETANYLVKVKDAEAAYRRLYPSGI